MKNVKYLFLLSLFFIGCFGCHEEKAKILREQVEITKSKFKSLDSFSTGEIYFEVIEYEGHKYIANHWGYSGSLLHLESCPCKNNNTNLFSSKQFHGM